MQRLYKSFLFFNYPSVVQNCAQGQDPTKGAPSAPHADQYGIAKKSDMKRLHPNTHIRTHTHRPQ